MLGKEIHRQAVRVRDAREGDRGRRRPSCLSFRGAGGSKSIPFEMQ